MKAEKPATGIMKTSDFGDSKFYKVVCGCGQPDHDIDFEVESADIGVTVNTYVTAKTDYWSEAVKKRFDIDNPYFQELDWAVKDLINGFVARVKLTWTVWTKGYIRCESTIIMTEQQAFNYAETIKSAAQDVIEFRSKHDVKNKEAIKAALQGDCV